MRILLVDDEQSLIEVFTQTLQLAGFEMVTAGSGQEGLIQAKTQHPDMILLDQVLPDVNGNQVLQMLKRDPETKDIPVAMLSNFNQDGMVQEAINLGALDYIMKYQIEPKDLVDKINTLMTQHGTNPFTLKSQPLPQPNSSAPLNPPVPPAPQPDTNSSTNQTSPTPPPPSDQTSSTPIEQTLPQPSITTNSPLENPIPPAPTVPESTEPEQTNT